MIFLVLMVSVACIFKGAMCENWQPVEGCSKKIGGSLSPE